MGRRSRKTKEAPFWAWEATKAARADAARLLRRLRKERFTDQKKFRALCVALRTVDSSLKTELLQWAQRRVPQDENDIRRRCAVGWRAAAPRFGAVQHPVTGTTILYFPIPKSEQDKKSSSKKDDTDDDDPERDDDGDASSEEAMTEEERKRRIADANPTTPREILAKLAMQIPCSLLAPGESPPASWLGKRSTDSSAAPANRPAGTGATTTAARVAAARREAAANGSGVGQAKRKSKSTKKVTISEPAAATTSGAGAGALRRGAIGLGRPPSGDDRDDASSTTSSSTTFGKRGALAQITAASVEVGDYVLRPASAHWWRVLDITLASRTITLVLVRGQPWEEQSRLLGESGAGEAVLAAMADDLDRDGGKGDSGDADEYGETGPGSRNRFATPFATTAGRTLDFANFDQLFGSVVYRPQPLYFPQPLAIKLPPRDPQMGVHKLQDMVKEDEWLSQMDGSARIAEVRKAAVARETMRRWTVTKDAIHAARTYLSDLHLSRATALPQWLQIGTLLKRIHPRLFPDFVEWTTAARQASRNRALHAGTHGGGAAGGGVVQDRAERLDETHCHRAWRSIRPATNADLAPVNAARRRLLQYRKARKMHESLSAFFGITDANDFTMTNLIMDLEADGDAPVSSEELGSAHTADVEDNANREEEHGAHSPRSSSRLSLLSQSQRFRHMQQQMQHRLQQELVPDPDVRRMEDNEGVVFYEDDQSWRDPLPFDKNHGNGEEDAADGEVDGSSPGDSAARTRPARRAPNPMRLRVHCEFREEPLLPPELANVLRAVLQAHVSGDAHAQAISQLRVAAQRAIQRRVGHGNRTHAGADVDAEPVADECVARIRSGDIVHLPHRPSEWMRVVDIDLVNRHLNVVVLHEGVIEKYAVGVSRREDHVREGVGYHGPPAKPASTQQTHRERPHPVQNFANESNPTSDADADGHNEGSQAVVLQQQQQQKQRHDSAVEGTGRSAASSPGVVTANGQCVAAGPNKKAGVSLEQIPFGDLWGATVRHATEPERRTFDASSSRWLESGSTRILHVPIPSAHDALGDLRRLAEQDTVQRHEREALQLAHEQKWVVRCIERQPTRLVVAWSIPRAVRPVEVSVAMFRDSSQCTPASHDGGQPRDTETLSSSHRSAEMRARRQRTATARAAVQPTSAVSLFEAQPTANLKTNRKQHAAQRPYPGRDPDNPDMGSYRRRPRNAAIKWLTVYAGDDDGCAIWGLEPCREYLVRVRSSDDVKHAYRFWTAPGAPSPPRLVKWVRVNSRERLAVVRLQVADPAAGKENGRGKEPAAQAATTATNLPDGCHFTLQVRDISAAEAGADFLVPGTDGVCGTTVHENRQRRSAASMSKVAWSWTNLGEDTQEGAAGQPEGDWQLATSPTRSPVSPGRDAASAEWRSVVCRKSGLVSVPGLYVGRRYAFRCLVTNPQAGSGLPSASMTLHVPARLPNQHAAAATVIPPGAGISLGGTLKAKEALQQTDEQADVSLHSAEQAEQSTQVQEARQHAPSADDGDEFEEYNELIDPLDMHTREWDKQEAGGDADGGKLPVNQLPRSPDADRTRVMLEPPRDEQPAGEQDESPPSLNRRARTLPDGPLDPAFSNVGEHLMVWRPGTRPCQCIGGSMFC